MNTNIVMVKIVRSSNIVELENLVNKILAKNYGVVQDIKLNEDSAMILYSSKYITHEDEDK